ncbi:hypothetical protein BV898_17552 [Hypsibius exemplaris]|uniref:SUEL-type lectin domain-containing protein n=1 Tax=Hypsibius exemplaris TaxID=2072580 RepID=A0A9X6RMA1_HYPEX|nr:hypothetical protein BV898_17552 [Hypsibius exemplaris]
MERSGRYVALGLLLTVYCAGTTQGSYFTKATGANGGCPLSAFYTSLGKCKTVDKKWEVYHFCLYNSAVKTHCFLRYDNSGVLGDPCPGYPKELWVNYTCEKNRPHLH